MERLRFIQTMSVEEFKKGMSIPRIEIKRNSSTGKYFFVFGTNTGAVSERFMSQEVKNPMVSQVCSEDTGQMFYMIHQRGEGVTTLAVL